MSDIIIIIMSISAVSESKIVKSESESSPLSPSPSPSHHFRVRVKKNSSPSHESSSPHIRYFFIFQNMKTTTNNNNNNKNVSNASRVEKAQHGTAATAYSGVTRAGPSHESRFLSPSPSQKNWTRVRVIKNGLRVRVPTRVTQHWCPCYVFFTTLLFHTIFPIVRYLFTHRWLEVGY